MANIKKTVSTPIAIEVYSDLNLSHEHVTTANFMDFNVATCMELVPKQSISVDHKLFSRLEPLTVPTFGNGNIHNKAFFVPYRTIFPAFQDMDSDVAHVFPDSTVAHVNYLPRFTNYSAIMLFISPVFSTAITEIMFDSTDENWDRLDTCDFVLHIQEGSPSSRGFRGYNFTKFGARAFKLLQSLGYGFDFTLSNEYPLYHNAMPLLAVVKVYMDWFYPSTYIQDEFATAVQAILDYDSSTTDFSDYCNQDKLYYLLQVVDRVNYDADYFVSAWDNPVSPTSGSYSNIAISDPTNSLGSVQQVITSGNGTPVTQSDDATPTQAGVSQFSQFMLNSLRKLTDYMQRNRIAGARVLDRYLARYGVTLSSEKLKRSEFISAYEQPLKFGDVTSTAATEGSPLGSFAGYGTSLGNGSFSYTATEKGMLLIVSSIVPKASYFQGANRITMHQTALDMWTPEYDNLGVQALATRELYMPMDSRKQYNQNVEDKSTLLDYNRYVFGFTSRYAEYKRGHDLITGDYRLNSKNRGREAWTLFRNLDDVFYNGGVEATHHDIDFVRGLDAEQYKRIFDTVANQDYFNIYHIFYVRSKFPGKPLFESYEFENEDSSQKVNIEIGGVKAN